MASYYPAIRLIVTQHSETSFLVCQEVIIQWRIVLMYKQNYMHIDINHCTRIQALLIKAQFV